MTISLFFLMWGLATALALPLFVPFHAREVGGIRAFTAANALAVLSLLAYASSQLVPTCVYVMVSNAAWVCALSLVYVGVRLFFSMPPHMLRTAVLGVFCIVAFMLTLSAEVDLRVRIVLFSVYTCTVALATGRVIFRQRKRLQTRGVMLYLMLAIFGLAALHALRVAVYTVGGQAPASLLDPSPWGLFFIVCGTVTVPALTFDSLTRAYSRRSILDELGRELRRCKRAGGKLAVLVLDIDHFKSINDRHGHAGGDTALRHYAQVVQRAVRTSDRFGRLGGEEFVLLMYDCDPAHALVQAQRVCDAVRDAPLQLQGVEVPMTTSGGLALYQPGDSADGILARADVALYRAKQQGRDRVEMAWTGRAPGRAQPAVQEASEPTA
jgi:diguanylate cyclase (GGDEF)-like protein